MNMTTYLQELHEVFPNGLQAPLPLKDRTDANLLISLFDEFEVEEQKCKPAGEESSEARALVDAILYQIDPSLVSEGIGAHSSSRGSATALETPIATSAGSRPDTPSSASTLATDERVASASSEHVSTTSTSLPPQDLHSLAGKAIAGKDISQTPDESPSAMKRVPNPAPVSRHLSTGNERRSVPQASPPSSPSSTGSRSAETSPPGTGFLSTAGRFTGDNGAAAATVAVSQAIPSKAAGRSSPRNSSERKPGRSSIFNKTSIRPSVPAVVHRRVSSESEGPPPMLNRYPTRRSRPSVQSAHHRGADTRKSFSRATEPPKVHRWDLDDESQKTFNFIQKRYISSGELIDPVANTRQADFTGFQNGWKPVPSATAGRHSDGYVLGGSSVQRRNRTRDDGSEDEESRPTPFHWTGDLDLEPGKKRLIGKGALGSRPGTFKSRSDERFAAATAALGSEQEAGYVTRATDPLQGMHPAAASWEMQRRGILLRSDRRPHSAKAA